MHDGAVLLILVVVVVAVVVVGGGGGGGGGNGDQDNDLVPANAVTLKTQCTHIQNILSL